MNCKSTNILLLSWIKCFKFVKMKFQWLTDQLQLSHTYCFYAGEAVPHGSTCFKNKAKSSQPKSLNYSTRCVSQSGTVSITLWNPQYHALKLTVSRCEIHGITLWYAEYQAVIRRILRALWPKTAKNEIFLVRTGRLPPWAAIPCTGHTSVCGLHNCRRGGRISATEVNTE